MARGQHDQQTSRPGLRRCHGGHGGRCGGMQQRHVGGLVAVPARGRFGAAGDPGRAILDHAVQRPPASASGQDGDGQRHQRQAHRRHGPRSRRPADREAEAWPHRLDEPKDAAHRHPLHGARDGGRRRRPHGHRDQQLPHAGAGAGREHHHLRGRTRQTYGVGMPITLTFDHPVTNRRAVERALHVRASKPVTGAWYWDGDSTVYFRPRNYWPAAHHRALRGRPGRRARRRPASTATHTLTQVFTIGALADRGGQHDRAPRPDLPQQEAVRDTGRSAPASPATTRPTART